MSWRSIVAVNSRYGWVAQTLGVTFVDPNSWVGDWDLVERAFTLMEEERDTWVNCTAQPVVMTAGERNRAVRDGVWW
jgi:hypothetical protein